MTVQEIYDKYSEGSYGNYHLLWGPTHIVWEDGNMGNSSLEHCWKACKECAMDEDDQLTLIDIEFCEASLFMLSLIPEEERYEQWKNLER